MQTAQGTYPVTIISRRTVAKHNRLRFSWFLIGTVFGIITSFTAGAVLGTHEPAEAPATAAISPQSKAEPKLAPKIAPITKAKIAIPTTYTLTVENGDTLISILTDTGIPYVEAHNAVEALKQVYNPRRIDIGQSIAVDIDPQSAQEGEPKLAKLSLPISKTSHVELERRKTGDFAVKKIEAPTHMAVARAAGVITSSFYETGLKAGIPAPLLEEVIKAYSYDVDFQRDIHDGDTLEVMYEKVVTDEGDSVGHGDVIFASLKQGKEVLNIYRYADGSADAEYYNEKGETVKKALLRTPMNGARISSGFGMRMHPIMGYSRMHRGVDFAAATGTPIYAAGDGVVEFMGRKGGYGNYVRIKHNNKYSTAYAHVSKFGKGLKDGAKVKQGQVIAYVGSTGASTGPHLHYEILAGNQQVNPSSVKFKTGNVLGGKQLAAFKQYVGKTRTQLAALRDGSKVASAKPAEPAKN